MKNKIKYFICFVVSLFVFVSILLLLNVNGQDENTRGKIIVWSDENTYDYINSVAQQYMTNNIKSKIKVVKVNENDIENQLANALSIGEMPNIIEINSDTLKRIQDQFDVSIGFNNMDSFANNYSSNYTSRMFQDGKIEDSIIAFPLTTNPIVLYLRDDMLKEYGYKSININTWEDLINMGKDVFNKSGGKIRILKATGRDYDYLISLLTMQAMEESNSKIEIKEKVDKNIELLKEENILNYDEAGSYLARLSSMEAMGEIIGINQECAWTANNAPAITNGSNRFYLMEGKSLAVINNDGNNNNKLAEKFLGALTINSENIINYVDNKLFLSSLSVYNNKQIEIKYKNFDGKSPLVVMSNIAKKAPKINDYSLYKEIRNDYIKSTN